MIKHSIVDLDLFKVIDEITDKTYYGSNQEWYGKWWKRLSGCGPSVASNLMLYLNNRQSASGSGRIITKTDCQLLMEEIWKYMTPSIQGISTTKKFSQAVLSYSNSKGLSFKQVVLDVPKKKENRPELSAVLDFLKDALLIDTPVAFLNLDNGKEKNLDAWHWVTITSFEYEEEGNYALLDIIDNGIIKRIDLASWLDATKLGGGFVYFIYNI